MTQDWSVPAWAVLGALGLLLAVIVVLALTARASRLRIEEQMISGREASAALALQVAELEARLDAGSEAREEPEKGTHPALAADYVITRIGETEPDEESTSVTLPSAVFADLVLRESAARAAGLGAGLRRALAPETRNRIRFEMRQQIKRSRKQRKADLRVARREWEARQRTTDVGERTA